MKNFKTIFLVYIFIFFSTMAFAQSITVTDPAEDETVNAGTAYFIKWTKSGTMHSSVKIRLYNSSGTTKIKNIINSTSNDGSYKTRSSIFNYVPSGSYVIRVKTLDNAVYDDSEVFILKSTAAQKTTKKPYSSYSKKDIPVITCIPYIKSIKVTDSFNDTNKFGIYTVKGPHYVHNFEIVIGNRGRESTKGIRLQLNGKRRLSTFDPPFPPQLGLGPNGIPAGGSKKIKGKLMTYTPGVFENKVELEIYKTNKLISEKTFYYKFSGLPDLWIKVSTKLKHKSNTIARMTVTIINIGDAESSNCRLGIYITRKMLTYYPIRKIKPGATQTIHAAFKWHYIIADVHIFADHKDKIEEKFERNNMVHFVMTEWDGIGSNSTIHRSCSPKYWEHFKHWQAYE